MTYKRGWTVYAGELYGVSRFAIEIDEVVYLCYVMISFMGQSGNRPFLHRNKRPNLELSVPYSYYY
jgi:hypothetical protein